MTTKTLHRYFVSARWDLAFVNQRGETVRLGGFTSCVLDRQKEFDSPEDLTDIQQALTNTLEVSGSGALVGEKRVPTFVVLSIAKMVTITEHEQSALVQ